MTRDIFGGSGDQSFASTACCAFSLIRSHTSPITAVTSSFDRVFHPRRKCLQTEVMYRTMRFCSTLATQFDFKVTSLLSDKDSETSYRPTILWESTSIMCVVITRHASKRHLLASQARVRSRQLSRSAPDGAPFGIFQYTITLITPTAYVHEMP